MRRIAAFVVAAALLAACGGGDDDAPESGVPDRTREIPADVQAFLDRVADDPAKVPFSATYHLLTKTGGAEHTVAVASSPPDLQVTIDGQPIDLADEAKLSSYGIFSGFLAANPAAAIAAAARRTDAGDAVFTKKEIAGTTLDCIAVPVQGAQTSTACLTPQGVVGYVDNPTAQYQLLTYEPR
jgi:hypothetical protein